MDMFKSLLRVEELNNSKINNNNGSTIAHIIQQSNSPEMAVLGVSDLKRVFDKFDTDGDGKISSQELEAAMRRLGQPPASDEELQMMMEDMDSDRDGLVDAGEFLNYYANILDAATVVFELEQAFSVYDLDCDGLITAEELQMTLINFGEEATLKQCKKMIEFFDCDGDGCINFQEFKIMMCSADVSY